MSVLRTVYHHGVEKRFEYHWAEFLSVNLRWLIWCLEHLNQHRAGFLSILHRADLCGVDKYMIASIQLSYF